MEERVRFSIPNMFLGSTTICLICAILSSGVILPDERQSITARETRRPVSVVNTKRHDLLAKHDAKRPLKALLSFLRTCWNTIPATT